MGPTFLPLLHSQGREGVHHCGLRRQVGIVHASVFARIRFWGKANIGLKKPYSRNQIQKPAYSAKLMSSGWPSILREYRSAGETRVHALPASAVNVCGAGPTAVPSSVSPVDYIHSNVDVSPAIHIFCRDGFKPTSVALNTGAAPSGSDTIELASAITLKDVCPPG
jgi:hypothetical protein